MSDPSEPTREPPPPIPPIPVTAVARELLAGSGADAAPTTVQAREAGTAQPSLPVVVADTGTPPTARAETRVLWREGVPRKLGPYELLEEIGHGGMGVVYRARHERLGTMFAVKVLIAGEFASLEAIARFHREAAAVAKMGKHPNIVTVFDLGQEAGLTYYAMELVRGKSLRERLAERVYEPKEAAALVEKVARALHFAHGHGIIHRDMKPHNVVVTDDGEPQVMDFGLARDVSSEAGLSVTGEVFGSPNYMAPEQVRGLHEECDARTDVYGLGGVLYEVLTKLPPHPGRAVPEIFAHILRGEVLSPRRVNPEVPRDLETVCLKCLDLDRDRRYATAEALADDLARFQRGEPVVARPVGRVGRAVRRVRRHPLVSGLLAGLVVLALGLGWKFLAPARLVYTTDPPGATVDVSGTTLWRGRVLWPARPFKFRVTHEDCLPEEREILASPGATIDLGLVKLRPNYGFLRLQAEPDGAEVLLDGQSLGPGHGTAEFKVAVGNHRLLVRAERYEPLERLITIESGKPLEAGLVKLERERGTLELTGTPREMSVVVWDVAANKEVTRLSPPATLALEAGEYELRGSLRDYLARDTPLVVRKNSTVRADLPLTRQRLWAYETGGEVWSSPALGDLNGDGYLDCVVGSDDTKVYALSGMDGAVLWAHETGERVLSSPELGDLNGDGCLDCIVGSRDKNVYALSGRDGAVLWAYETGGQVHSSPALGDLNGDGVLDCVVGSMDKKVYALSGRNGAVLWGYKTGQPVESPPTLGDLNGDGVLDCVVGSGDKNVYALSGRDGGILWSCETGDMILSSAALGDVNEDGVLDCVVGSDDKKVYAMSGKDGAVLWAYESGDRVLSSPALGDLNGDGVLDCIVGSRDNKVYALSGKDGAILWTYESGAWVLSSPALGDLNGDGCLDCVVGSYDWKVYALSGRDGAVLWAYETGGPVHSSPALGDVNGDGCLDCVVGSWDKKVYALSGRDGAVLWAYESGNLLESSPALADLNGDGILDCVVGSDDRKVHALSGSDGAVLWAHESRDVVSSSPTLGDLNEDGVLDCVVGSHDKKVYALSGRNGAVLWAYETGGWVRSSPALGDLNADGYLDCVVGSDDTKVYALSGRNGGVLWTHKTSRDVYSSPALGDLNGDGVLDCVVGSLDKKVYALSGKNGDVLWTWETGDRVFSSPALGDLNGDGVLDCVVGSMDKKVYALSGRNGAVLWTCETGNGVFSSPALGDLNGDGVLDCVVGSWDKNVYALSGRNGAVLWTYEAGGKVFSSTALRDLDGDACVDCVVGSNDGMIHALSGRDGAVLWACKTGDWVVDSPALGDLSGDGCLDCVVGSSDGRVCAIRGPDPNCLRASAKQRLGFYRGGRWWRTLAELTTERLAEERNPWARATTCVYLGIARAWLGQPKDALDAFAEARKLHLRAPDGAVYEWVASRALADATPEQRAEADGILLDALGFEPDVVFDTLVECRDLLAKLDPVDLRAILARVAETPACAIERPLLLALPMSDGSRPYANKADLLTAAQHLVLARIARGEGDAARNLGYLALIADALGDKDAFAKTYATYLDLPRRPESLDALLQQIATRK